MPTQPEATSQPVSILEIDKKLQKQFMFNGFFLSLALVLIPLILIPTQMKLAHMFPSAFGWTTTGPKATTTPANMYPGTSADLTHVYTSLPNVAIDIFSAALIMFVFWTGISRINKSLLGYGRMFVERKQWAEVTQVLSSFNQQGQHFLDRTGEVHYLLALAFQHLGKVQTAQKARDYVVKYRPKSEWAEKILQQGGVKAPAKAARVTVGDAAKPHPAKGKRRRF